MIRGIIGICLGLSFASLPIAYWIGWHRGWDRRARLAAYFEATIRPLERGLGWVRCANGLPPHDEPVPAKPGVLQ